MDVKRQAGRLEPQPNVGIMFGDVRGYSQLTHEEVLLFYSRGLPILAERLRDRCKELGVADAVQSETWGDGIACVHAQPLASALYALLISEEFDGVDWREELGFRKRLRIRLALHAGHLWRGTQNWLLSREQYIGPEMVLPARLEPKVRPGEVWCTEEFKDSLERLESPPQALVMDPMPTIQLVKGAGPARAYRVRFRRDHEEELQALEQQLSDADDAADSAQFLEVFLTLQKFIAKECQTCFPVVSTYAGWDQVGERLLFLGHSEVAEELLLAYRQDCHSHGLLSNEDEVRLCCVLANCASSRADVAGTHQQRLAALRRARNYVDSSSAMYAETKEDRVELASVVAAQEKRIGVLASGLRQKRQMLKRAHRRYLHVYATHGFGHYPGINTATTAAMLACLQTDKGVRASHSKLSKEIAHSVLLQFELRPARHFWEWATVAEAYVLLGQGGNARRALLAVEGSEFQRLSFRRQMDSLATFAGLDPRVRKAAQTALSAT